MTQWFIAGIRYPSGRAIFVGAHPERADFTATRETAAEWPGEQHAKDAAAALLTAFRLANPEVLKVFIEPSTTPASA
jgi:hypothetical protein